MAKPADTQKAWIIRGAVTYLKLQQAYFHISKQPASLLFFGSASVFSLQGRKDTGPVPL